MIEMTNITKFYDNFRALNNINLKVEKGEIIGLLGPNGAGKTTAMRILTCFIPATSGSASVAGYDVFEDSLEVRRRLGYLPETPPLYPEMTVGSYLNFIGELRELSAGKRRERINYVAERIGLTECLTRVIGTLSKGYRQRVGLAQALLHNPEVLILDEPTVGLDPSQIIEIRGLVKDLARDHTIILSTHILTEVSMTCGRVVIINEGEIVAVDSVANLEKAAAGKPAWNICIRPAAGKDWRQMVEKHAGAAISELVEMPETHHFKLSLDKAEDFDDLFRNMTGAGHVLREITPVKATLEDVFLKLTSAEERKEAA
ncbi:MAG TPA: ABC transporter ATP-binding protein [Candidatus Ozemobacteraceae bacterium]|nr:ABC transporter ATP-binding protein [Candidatus Ozemobacteraceae bacterium]